MKQEELNKILLQHKAWLNGEEGGKHANLQGADLYGAILRQAILEDSDLRGAILRGADLRDSDLRGADLRDAGLQQAELQDAILLGADLRRSDLWRADFRHADMRGADLDYASWPLWCGSLKAYVDDRIAIQLLYHTLSVVQHSPYVSEDVKKALLSAENVRIANRFHRVGECGKIKEWEEEDK